CSGGCMPSAWCPVGGSGSGGVGCGAVPWLCPPVSMWGCARGGVGDGKCGGVQRGWSGSAGPGLHACAPFTWRGVVLGMTKPPRLGRRGSSSGVACKREASQFREYHGWSSSCTPPWACRLRASLDEDMQVPDAVERLAADVAALLGELFAVGPGAPCGGWHVGEDVFAGVFEGDEGVGREGGCESEGVAVGVHPGFAVCPGEAAAGAPVGVGESAVFGPVAGAGLPLVVGPVLDDGAAAVDAGASQPLGEEAGDAAGGVAHLPHLGAVVVPYGLVGVVRGPDEVSFEEGEDVAGGGLFAAGFGPHVCPDRKSVV